MKWLIIILVGLVTMTGIANAQTIFEEYDDHYYIYTNKFIIREYKDTLGYNSIYESDGSILIQNERYYMEELQPNNKWKQLGTPQTTNTYQQNGIQIIERYYTDFYLTNYTISHIVHDNEPIKIKIQINNPLNKTLRLKWELNGITYDNNQQGYKNQYITKDNEYYIIYHNNETEIIQEPANQKLTMIFYPKSNDELQIQKLDRNTTLNDGTKLIRNSLNEIELTKNNSHTIINSSLPILDLGDIRISQEWEYYGEGNNTEYVYNNNIEIIDSYVCDNTTKTVIGNGLGKRTLWNSCIYYPGKQTYDNKTNITTNSRTIEKTDYGAKITFNGDYDPEYGDFTEGLISCWNFDNDAKDIMELNNGTVSGATLDNSEFKVGTGSYNFSGDKITISDNANLRFGAGNFTIIFWAKIYADASSYQYHMGKGDTGGDEWMLRRNSNEVSFFAYGGGGSLAMDTPYPDSNDWTQLVFTGNGTHINLAVDNVWDGGPDTSPYDFSSTKDLVFGNPDNSGSRLYYGWLDEIMIWNIYLHPDNVTTIWNNSAGLNCSTIAGLSGGEPPEEDTNFVDCSLNPVTNENREYNTSYFINGTGTWEIKHNITWNGQAKPQSCKTAVKHGEGKFAYTK